MRFRLQTPLVSLALLIASGAFLMACESDGPANEGVADAAPRAEESPTTQSSDTEALCTDMGPQTPRDISNREGLNTTAFPLAPASSEMNLCNIHTHTNAEHKGPGYAVFFDATDSGGYACNETTEVSESELTEAPGAFEGVRSGDTIEVHWVHTSCEATPGEGLGACVPEGCQDPLLRVEAQVFLVVNRHECPRLHDDGLRRQRRQRPSPAEDDSR